MTASHIPDAIEIVFIGVVATATLDLWSITMHRALGQPLTNWAHVGRWIADLPRGTFRHAAIAEVPPRAGELGIGWTTHYVVGIVYAALYLLALAAAGSPPTFSSAALFGLVTVLAPWLILQPGIGAGFFASRTPAPGLTRVRNVVAHVIFGIGLYVGWELLSALGQA